MSLLDAITGPSQVGPRQGLVAAGRLEYGTLLPRRRLNRWAVVLGLATALAFSVVALTSFAVVRGDLGAKTEAGLAQVADSKVAELSLYRAERLADGRELARNAAFVAVVQQALGAPEDRRARSQIAAWLENLAVHEGFEYVRVLDHDANVIAATFGAGMHPVASTIIEQIRTGLGSETVEFVDFYQDPVEHRAHLAVLACVSGTPAGCSAIAELSIDPTQFLYPSIETWATPSATGETLLARRDGDGVEFISPLRFDPDAAFNRRIPLAATDTPAVQGALGYVGTMEGIDYRGEPVISMVRTIPESPWILVAKMDIAEAVAPLGGRVLVTILLLALLGTAVLGGGATLWHRLEVRRLLERLEVEQRHAWLLEAIDQSRDAIFVVDPQDARLLYANRGASHDLGYTPEELLRLTPADFAPGFSMARFGTLLASLAEPNRGLINLKSTARRKDGTTFPVDLRLQLVAAETGLQCLAFATDITEAQAQAVERDRLIAAVEQAGDAIVILDRSQLITYANEALTAMTGFARDDLYGSSLAMIAGYDQLAQAGLWSALAAGTTWSGLISGSTADGRLFEADWTLTPLRDSSGELTGHVAAARDRTHERALEAQVARMERLESVGQLAAGVAHDFNNLLTAVIGYGELLRGSMADDDPAREDAEQILAAAGRGATLVRQLLAFSRRQVLQPQVLNLNAVIDGVVPMLRRLLGEQVELSTHLDPDLGRLLADPGQMEQVLVNLCTNARDAMPDGGALTIETANVDLDDNYAAIHPGAIAGPYAMLAVSDTGTGMDAATASRIFEPFFTTKGQDRGTGLGLATVHGIVGQSGGHVAVYSELGVGTTFRVYLPRVPGQVADHPSQRLDGPTGGHERILLVEDDPAIRGYAARVLQDQGYGVVVAAAPAEALALPPSEISCIDLLVTDVVMPGMSGIHLAEAVRAVCPGVRVLWMSGYAEQSARRRLTEEPTTAFIPKPFTSAILATAVRDLLDLRAATDGPAHG
ncbi:MAG TPA: PAS domain S-box protein [Propionicimonas sp.]